jgi:GGDEF domain-containing protein
MIEGRDVGEAIGSSQLGALRAEFSRIGMMPVFDPAMVTAGHATVVQLALALVAFGVSAVPSWVGIVLAVGAAITAARSVSVRLADRRRTGRATAALDAGGSAADALRAAGIDCWAVWLDFRRESFEYEPRPCGDDAPNAEEVAELCKRALRPGERGRKGSLASGTWFEISDGERVSLRLAAGSRRRLSAFESHLLEHVASRARGETPEVGRPELTVVGGDERRGVAWQPAVIVIELNAFENVRVVSGQLSAERVENEAISRLRVLLREGDMLKRLAEDRFAVVLAVTDPSQADGVCRRIEATLREVPVPHRAAPITPVLRTYMHGEITADPQLAALLEQFQPSETRKAG